MKNTAVGYFIDITRAASNKKTESAKQETQHIIKPPSTCFDWYSVVTYETYELFLTNNDRYGTKSCSHAVVIAHTTNIWCCRTTSTISR